ncbi:hypothetical protein JCM3774_005089 [Rhodotorula dairenensis]
MNCAPNSHSPQVTRLGQPRSEAAIGTTIHYHSTPTPPPPPEEGACSPARLDSDASGPDPRRLRLSTGLQVLRLHSRAVLSPSTARATPEPLLAPTEDSAAARTTPDPDPELDHPLFKPAFSLRQLKRLQRAAHRVERHDRKQLKKGTIGAEVKVAMGVLEYIEIERRNKQKLHGKSAGPGRGHGRRRGSEAGAGGGAGRDGLAGLVQDLESQVEHRLEAVRGEGTPTPTPVSATEEPRGRERDAGADTGRVTRNQVLAGVGGAATVVGLVGAAGYEWWQHRHGHEPRGGTSRRGRDQRDTRTSEHVDLPARRDLSGNRPKAAAAIAPSATVGSIPRPLADPSPHPPPTPYLSTLTPAQHHLVQHAAAALLLKQKHEHEGVHDKLHRAIGGFEHMVRTLEAGVQSAWRGVHDHAPSVMGQGTRPSKLFGTPLGYLAKHEGIDSFHGADPHGTVRIPDFLDHCITAMMQADVTVEGLLRKNGKVRIVREIMHALDNSGGDDTVIDLAALDPVTLADLFKQFLGALPDPVMTGHLFKLFIACSHISHVGIRRRCMHLVICMMPKVNRDVLEVVFLFLEWLSRFAHVTVKDGNRMDLTSIATVMAPTLLRPGHRDPKPFEVRPMIAAVLSLLEDQHLLHAVPPELARVLHLEVPRDHPHGPASGLQGGAALLHTLAKVL